MREFLWLAALWLATSAVAAPPELRVVEHLADHAHPSAVRCEHGSVFVRAGGAISRIVWGHAELMEGATWPAVDRERAERGRRLEAASPRRDRLLRSDGLRASVRGACAAGRGVLCWYDDAAPGMTVLTGGAWRDLAPGTAVLDADCDGTEVWAVTPAGLVHLPLDGSRAPEPVMLPASAPGNALDGAFVHEGRLHVFGPRGLFAVGTTAPVTFTAVIGTPIQAAAAIPGGAAAVTGAELRMLPGRVAYPAAVPGTWALAGARDRRVYLATSTAISSFGPGRPVPVVDVAIAAPPRALYGAGDALAVALAGAAGGVLLGRMRSGALELTRLPLTALCFHEGPAGLLAGTPDGLASIEGDRVHWYLHQPDLAVTAIAQLDDRLVLATTDGLALLDGPVIAARVPLDGARVTALVPHGGELWAATAAHGLYRVRVSGGARR